jgi:hypothetical protein
MAVVLKTEVGSVNVFSSQALAHEAGLGRQFRTIACSTEPTRDFAVLWAVKMRKVTSSFRQLGRRASATESERPNILGPFTSR